MPGLRHPEAFQGSQGLPGPRQGKTDEEGKTEHRAHGQGFSLRRESVDSRPVEIHDEVAEGIGEEQIEPSRRIDLSGDEGLPALLAPLARPVVVNLRPFNLPMPLAAAKDGDLGRDVDRLGLGELKGARALKRLANRRNRIAP